MFCHALDFEISQGTQAIFIAMGPLPHTFFRVIGPDGAYKGYLMTGFKYPPIYYTSASKNTLNAKRHEPLSGTYTLQMISFDPQLNPESVSFKVYENEAAVEQLEAYEASVLSALDLWDLPSEDICVNEEGRFYRGDLHAHTFLSDGVLTVDGARRAVLEKALDFMAITDHNLVPMGFGPIGASHIPAFELTLPTGHMNVHGLVDPDIYKGLLTAGAWSLNDALRTFLPKCHVAINHPFFPPWDFQLDLSLVDALEIICDPEYPGSDLATEKAISFLDFAWSRGIVIFAVGGSDSHGEAYGDPVTHVFAAAPRVSLLIEGLKKGHVMVTRGMALEATYVMKDGPVLPGSAVKRLSDLQAVRVVILPEADANYELRVVCNGKVIQSHVIMALSGQESRFQFEALDLPSQEGFKWLRFEIKNAQGEWVGFVNPIYEGTPNKSPGTWGCLMEAYREQNYQK